MDISCKCVKQIWKYLKDLWMRTNNWQRDCLWVIGEPISVFKESFEKETGILTEVDTYDWIAFLPMSDGGGAYNRYFGKLNTGKMKIRGVMDRKGDTPEYVNKMQQEVF